MSARQVLIAYLDAAGWPGTIARVDYAREVDPPSKPTALIRLDTAEPSPVARGAHAWGFALVLLASRADPGPADDELETTLELVLDVLNRTNRLELGRATRSIYADDVPAFEVTLTMHA